MRNSRTTNTKLDNLEKNTKEVIIEAKSVFPFQLFPDKISIDKNKIEIVYVDFFFMKRTFTILVEDLLNVKIHTGIFFASLYFEVEGYEKNPEPVSYLAKSDAMQIRDTIVGLIKAKREEVPIEKIHKKEAREKLKKIGQTDKNLASAV